VTDLDKLEKHIRKLLELIGEDPDDPELVETPRRIADMYRDFLRYKDVDPRVYLKRKLPTTHRELVMVRDIEFFSLCKHHLMPFFGKVHIAYIPHDYIVGLSKFWSLVQAYAHRLQIQETLTKQIADAIMQELRPFGVMVVCEAIHTCMYIRGRYDFSINSRTMAKTVTSAIRGVFEWNPSAKQEVLSLLQISEKEVT